jgi:hypothetical protein
MINKEGPTAWHEKANPRPNEPGVRRDPFWDNRALPGLSPGDFSSPYLLYKRLTGIGSASDQFLTQEQLVAKPRRALSARRSATAQGGSPLVVVGLA